MSQIVTIEVPDSIAEQYATWDELKDSVYESMVIREFQKGFLTERAILHHRDTTGIGGEL